MLDISAAEAVVDPKDAAEYAGLSSSAMKGRASFGSAQARASDTKTSKAVR
jgi:hypothetical protein